MQKNIISICSVLIIALIAGFALLHPGLPPTHDGEYHVIRFYEFDKVLRDGNLYPRWAPDLYNGFGIPLFNYVYPLPNYFASFLHAFGVSFIDAFKLNMFFATLFGAFFFYLWAKEYWGNAGGVISSAFYSFSPYRFVDTYIRGSVGEVWALAFFPALLWSYFCFQKTRKKKFFILTSVFLAFLVYSHNILALIFFVFFIFYALVMLIGKEQRIFRIKDFVLQVVIGLGLSSPFWIPALFETKYVVGLQIFDVTAHFPELYELIIPSWGSGFSGSQSFDKMSFQIGVANIIAIIFVVLKLFKNSKKNNPEKNIIIFFVVSFFLLIFLMLSYSSWIWTHFPLLPYLQFPWRLLSLEIVIASFLAGGLFQNIDIRVSVRKKIIFIFALVGVIFLGINYAKPAFYHMRSDNYYTTRSNFIDSTNSIGNVFNTKWLVSIPLKEKNKMLFNSGSGKVEFVRKKSTEVTFKVDAFTDSNLIFNNAYFPGWTGTMDSHEIKIDNFSGRDSFAIPKGSHIVEIKLKSTPIQNFSYLCFVIASTVLFFSSIKTFSGIIKK